LAEGTAHLEVSVRATWLILRGAARHGVPARAILAAVGLDEAVIEDHSARISHETEMAIWDAALDRIDDPAFGLHVGELSMPETFGPGGLAAMTSADLGESLERITRYLRLMHSSVEFGFEVRERTAHLSHRLAMPPWIMKRHAAETGAASAICRIRESVGINVRPVEVRFQHPAPQSIEEHERIFECPISFEQPRNELVLDAADLALPVRDAHPELCRTFEAQAEALLATLGAGDEIIDGVRRALFDSLSAGEVSLNGVAARLGVAAQELRDELAKRGTSFRAMLSAIRRDLAETYLQDKQWALMDIAFVLGFADTSAFGRAFKSWTGVSPSDYRRELFEQDAPS
jgi:AraC-like DNA-binding protein